MIAAVPLAALIGAALLGFSGLLAGNVLARVAEEEIEDGMPYFRWLRAGIGLTIVWTSSSFLFAESFALILGGIVGGLIMLAMERFSLYGFAYPLWGALLGINLVLSSNFSLLAGLIFLYGLVEAAMRFRVQEIMGSKDLLFIPLLFVAFLI